MIHKYRVRIFSLCLAMLFITMNITTVYGREVKNYKEPYIENKVVYLTFDDGPSVNNTEKVIDILKSENVKATFFLIGMEAEKRPHLVRKLLEAEMCIAPHSYSHETSIIYRNASNYIKDYEKCKEVLEHIARRPMGKYLRMPCGSYNPSCNRGVMKNIISELENRDLSYVDWNVSIEDALSKDVPVAKLKRNFLKAVEGRRYVVVLMHDGYYQDTTVEYLPEIIKYFKDNGYEFKTFDHISEEHNEYMRQHRLVNKKPLKKNKV